MQNSVIIRSYPRIHLGLLELSGTYMRVDGGVGLSVCAFPLTVTVRSSMQTELISQSTDAKRICQFVLSDLQNVLPHTCVQITLETEGNLHRGLGFATQCAFSVAQALLQYFHLDISPEKLALSLRRGGTSGIGIHAFYHGGFLVDGGHAFPKEKDTLAPTSQCIPRSIPPLIARLPFPNWPICIAIPKAAKLPGGQKEVHFWQEATPIPPTEGWALCHNLLMGMLPAVAEGDFHAFCHAVQISTTVGMKRREIVYWQPKFEQYSAALENSGWHGITLSSLGPAIIGFSEDVEAAARTKPILEHSGLFSSVTITAAHNTGFEILPFVNE